MRKGDMSRYTLRAADWTHLAYCEAQIKEDLLPDFTSCMSTYDQGGEPWVYNFWNRFDVAAEWAIVNDGKKQAYGICLTMKAKTPIAVGANRGLGTQSHEEIRGRFSLNSKTVAQQMQQKSIKYWCCK